MELAELYRPTAFKAVMGQEAATKQLMQMIKSGRNPHRVLFSGPSGCGKTTMARIYKEKLGVGRLDFTELNCANSRGIDMARDIIRTINLAPVSGKCRVFLLDECHQMTKEAQTLLLKPMEDTPAHVYFLFCSTDPEKMLPTFLGRCTRIKLLRVKHKDVMAVIRSVVKKEKTELSDDVVEAIATRVDGCVREALVLLQQILDIENEEQQLEIIAQADAKAQAIDIVRALINKKTRWPDMAKILRDVNEEPEGLRRMILAYCTSMMLANKDAGQMFGIIDTFRDNWFDSGRAGLAACCYEVITGTK